MTTVVPKGQINEVSCLSTGIYSQAERPISTGQLKALQPLHFPPINLVVYEGSSKSKPDWESLSWRRLGAYMLSALIRSEHGYPALLLAE